MSNYVFQVKQKTIGDHEHSWEAEELNAKQVILLPKGGQQSNAENLVGQYPEIEKYLLETYGIKVPLIYLPQIDSLTINSNGTTEWVFRRQAAEVIVRDIPRVIARIEFSLPS